MNKKHTIEVLESASRKNINRLKRQAKAAYKAGDGSWPVIEDGHSLVLSGDAIQRIMDGHSPCYRFGAFNGGRYLIYQPK